MSEIYQYILHSKNNMTGDQWQLLDMVRLSGVNMHPDLFKIIMDLLALNIPPHALLSLLKEISRRMSSHNDHLYDVLHGHISDHSR